MEEKILIEGEFYFNKNLMKKRLATGIILLVGNFPVAVACYLVNKFFDFEFYCFILTVFLCFAIFISGLLFLISALSLYLNSKTKLIVSNKKISFTQENYQQLIAIEKITAVSKNGNSIDIITSAGTLTISGCVNSQEVFSILAEQVNNKVAV